MQTGSNDQNAGPTSTTKSKKKKRPDQAMWERKEWNVVDVDDNNDDFLEKDSGAIRSDKRSARCVQTRVREDEETNREILATGRSVTREAVSVSPAARWPVDG